MPFGFPADIDGTCHFLDDYKHPTVSPDEPLDVHISAALKSIHINDATTEKRMSSASIEES